MGHENPAPSPAGLEDGRVGLAAELLGEYRFHRMACPEKELFRVARQVVVELDLEPTTSGQAGIGTMRSRARSAA